MWTLKCYTVVLGAIIFGLSHVYAQINLPTCILKCIDQSTDDSCSLTDVKCICRESNGQFLPDLVLCMHGACDNTLDVNALLTPLSLACELAGTPISQSALQNAQIQASSLALMTTVTVTRTGTNVAPSPVGPQTAPGETTTIITATEASGPNSIQTLPGTTGYTSTITTTNSAGSAVTFVSSFTQAGGAGASDLSSTSSATGEISPGTQSTTGTFVTSTTSTNPKSESTNSSPFGTQGSAGQLSPGSLLVLFAFVVVGLCLL